MTSFEDLTPWPPCQEDELEDLLRPWPPCEEVEDELDKAIDDEVDKALPVTINFASALHQDGTIAGIVCNNQDDAIQCIIDRLGDDVVRAQVHAKGAGRRAFQAGRLPLVSRWAYYKAKMDKEKEEADEAVERAERAYDRSVCSLMATCKQLHVVVYPKAREMYREWCLLQHAKSLNDWALETMHNRGN